MMKKNNDCFSLSHGGPRLQLISGSEKCTDHVLGIAVRNFMKRTT
jgi:hypothetical protein